MLIYQDGGASPGKRDLYFALGVNSRKIYLEWRVTAGSLVEVIIVKFLFFSHKYIAKATEKYPVLWAQLTPILHFGRFFFFLVLFCFVF